MQIDVTELFTDADTGGEPFQVIRRVQTVGDDGIAVIKNYVVPGVIGSVYPSGDNSMIRDEAYSQQMKSITVVTNFRLRGQSKQGSAQFMADLILTLGEYFIVRDVKDFSRYGSGFIEAGCLSYDFTDTAPQDTLPAVGTVDFSNPAQSGLIGAVA